MTPEQALQKAVKAKHLSESDQARAVLAEMVIEGRIPCWPLRGEKWWAHPDMGMREEVWRYLHYRHFQEAMKKPKEYGFSESCKALLKRWLIEGGEFPEVEATTTFGESVLRTLKLKCIDGRRSMHAVWYVYGVYSTDIDIHEVMHRYWLDHLEPIARDIAMQVQWNVKAL